MKGLARYGAAFLAAVTTAYLLGSVFATQVILSGLSAHSVPVTLRDRLHATGHDLLGLADTYLPLLVLAFLVALPVGEGLARFFARARLLLYLGAGAGAVITLHLAARAVLGITAIAAVREFPGLALQGLAGSCGAYVYFIATGWAHRPSPPPGELPPA